MTQYKGINLFNIIQDYETAELWSASSRAYELFGSSLSDNQTTHPVAGIDWLFVVRHPEHPTTV